MSIICAINQYEALLMNVIPNDIFDLIALYAYNICATCM